MPVIMSSGMRATKTVGRPPVMEIDWILFAARSSEYKHGSSMLAN